MGSAWRHMRQVPEPGTQSAMRSTKCSPQRRSPSWFSGEDQTADGQLRARENVVHKAGLFQGRLGFHRAIVLVEDGVQTFSNIAGITYIRFSKGNIRETFGDVVATIKREAAVTPRLFSPRTTPTS